MRNNHSVYLEVVDETVVSALVNSNHTVIRAFGQYALLCQLD